MRWPRPRAWTLGAARPSRDSSRPRGGLPGCDRVPGASGGYPHGVSALRRNWRVAAGPGVTFRVHHGSRGGRDITLAIFGAYRIVPVKFFGTLPERICTIGLSGLGVAGDLRRRAPMHRSTDGETHNECRSASSRRPPGRIESPAGVFVEAHARSHVRLMAGRKYVPGWITPARSSARP